MNKAPAEYVPSEIKHPVNLDAFQLGWLYSELDDLRKTWKFSFDFLNRYPQRPVLESIIKAVNETLVKIYQEERK